MNSYSIRDGLTYDDVLLVPKRSAIESRSLVDLHCNIARNYFKFPVIPANMKTVINQEVAEAIIEAGGLVILHRFMPLTDQVALLDRLRAKFPEAANNSVALSVGVKEEDFRNVEKIIETDEGIRIICIDIAHGDSSVCVEMIQHIRHLSSCNRREIAIIAGNVATGEGAMRLWRAGAQAVKVGIGPGSLCSTRIETGNGVPQLTALIDVANARAEWNKHHPDEMTYMHIIADGGIKSAGDCVKALCFADMVMAGNLFAGTDEAPGEVVVRDGKIYKRYEGSSTHKSNHVEGVKAMVESKGPVREVIRKLTEGIKSGCSYQGAIELFELRKEPEFIRVTNAGLVESHPHSMKMP